MRTVQYYMSIPSFVRSTSSRYFVDMDIIDTSELVAVATPTLVGRVIIQRRPYEYLFITLSPPSMQFGQLGRCNSCCYTTASSVPLDETNLTSTYKYALL